MIKRIIISVSVSMACVVFSGCASIATEKAEKCHGYNIDLDSHSAVTPDSGWRQYRRGGQLTGRTDLVGNLTTTPDILWQYYLGGRSTMLTGEFTASTGSLALPTSDVTLPMTQHNFEVKWGTFDGENLPFYDLDNDQTLTKDVSTHGYYNHKVGEFLSGVSGLEKVEWVATHGNDIYLYKRQSGNWVQQWHTSVSTAPATGAVTMEVIVGDFDDDGDLEIAGMVWFDLLVFDLATGNIEHRIPFFNAGSETGRGYGWFGAYDVTGDNKKEIIQLATLESHLDVFSWSGSTLYKVWGRVIEAGVYGKKTQLIPGVNPVEDIDGDGVREIVVSMYNYDYATGTTGDNKWHIYVIEVMTGNLLYNFENQFLTGLRDTDGDGLPELFTSETDGRTIKEPGKLRIYEWDDIGQEFDVRWETGVGEDSIFQSHDVREFPLNVATTASPARKTLLAEPVEAGGRPVFFTRRITNEPDNIIEVTTWQDDGTGAINPIGTTEGPGLEVLAARIPDVGETDSLLLRCEISHSGAAQLNYNNIAPAVLQSEKTLPPAGMPVIDQLKPGEPKTVLVQGAGYIVHAIQPYAPGGLETIWKKHNSRGTNKTVKQTWVADVSVPMANLTGDGTLAVLYTTKSETATARLVAADPNGDEIWHYDFDVSWMVGDYDFPTIVYWQTGNFTSLLHEDVVVQIRLTGHADFITYMLSGLDGSKIWSRTKAGTTNPPPTKKHGYTWTLGEYWYSIQDWDNDGLDDIFTGHYGTFFVVKGTNGNELFNLDTGFASWAIFPEDWVPYKSCMVYDFLDNGRYEILYAGQKYWVLIDPVAGVDLWSQQPQLVTSEHQLPGLGDFDGDGDDEIMLSSECRVLDPKTGDQKWSLPGVSGLTATADIDGDGRDECIVSESSSAGAGKTLYAVGTNPAGTAGEIRWSRSFPASIGNPVIVEMNGQMQIVVICQDGYIYGIGQSK